MDALVRLLNDYGYQPVFLPMTNVAPPEIYNLAGSRLVRRGPLKHYVKAPLPAPTRGRLADIEHKTTGRKKLTAATSFLENALRAIGITSIPKIELGFVGSDELVFSFSEVTTASIAPAALDPIIQHDLDPHAIPERYVAEGKVHLAYEYAYARRVRLRRADGQSFTHAIEGDLHDFINLGTTGEVSVEDETTISFAAASGQPAAFAYKAGRLERRDGRWELFPEEVLQARGGFDPDDDALPGGMKTPYLPTHGVVLLAEDDDAP